MPTSGCHKAAGTEVADRSGIADQVRRAGIALFLALLSLSGAMPVATAQEDEEVQAAEDSRQADDTVPPPEYRVVVDNRTAYPIDVIAYDEFDGSYAPYDAMPAGGAIDRKVEQGQLWLFEVNQQALIGQYITTDQPDQYVVLDDSTLAAAGYPPGPLDDSWRQFEETDADAAAPDATQDAAPAAAPTATPGSGG